MELHKSNVCDATYTFASRERVIPLRHANQIKLAQRHALHESHRIAALPFVHQRLGGVRICEKQASQHHMLYSKPRGAKGCVAHALLTAAQNQRTRLTVHGKVAQLHRTRGLYREPEVSGGGIEYRLLGLMRWAKRADLPHRVENVAVLREAQQLVGHGNRVHVRLLAVVEERVRSPDALQHLAFNYPRIPV